MGHGGDFERDVEFSFQRTSHSKGHLLHMLNAEGYPMTSGSLIQFLIVCHSYGNSLAILAVGNFLNF